jgi:hypothetical protein
MMVIKSPKPVYLHTILNVQFCRNFSQICSFANLNFCGLKVLQTFYTEGRKRFLNIILQNKSFADIFSRMKV